MISTCLMTTRLDFTTNYKLPNMMVITTTDVKPTIPIEFTTLKVAVDAVLLPVIPEEVVDTDEPTPPPLVSVLFDDCDVF